jgi:two-component system, cell cycle response regulator CpdR
MSRVVLVVDDMPSVSEVMAMMLEDLGCEVLMASTGDQALSILAQKHVDVLIADIDMPGMNGTELAQRATGRSPNLKVLLVSGGPTNAGLHRLAETVRSSRFAECNGEDCWAVLSRELRSGGNDLGPAELQVRFLVTAHHQR